MTDGPLHRTRPSPLTIGFVSLMVAWLATALSMIRAQWIVNEMWSEDVGDVFRVGVGNYIVERMLPFDFIAIVFHLICMGALIWASAKGTAGYRGYLDVIWFVSFIVHGLVFAWHLILTW